MKRKRWTPQTEVTESLLRFREKRKWQIMLRRYILEQAGGKSYAPFFGLDFKNFRSWIEIQFDNETNWSNFSKNWQFDHIIPVAYFDFNSESDLKLCWNFTNIRVEKLIMNKNSGNRVDVLAAKSYFENLYEHTNYPICMLMVKKIEQIEVSQIEGNANLERFMKEKQEYLTNLISFSEYEFKRLNDGEEMNSIIYERSFVERVMKTK
jgi:hypothetical protein